MKPAITWPFTAVCAIAACSVLMSGCSPKPPEHGTRFTLQVGSGAQDAAPVSAAALAATKHALEMRLDRLGADAHVEITNASRLLVLVPAMSDRKLASVRLAVDRQGLLSMRLVHRDSDALMAASETPVGYERRVLDQSLRSGNAAQEVLLVKQVMETGFPPWLVRRAAAVQNPIGQYEIALELNADAAQAFAQLTRDHVGERLAILFDDQLYSAPIIRGEIPGGRAVISGAFTREDAFELAVLMETPLPEPIHCAEQSAY